MAHDLVIRGGTVVDGTGAEPHEADVAVDGNRITEVTAPGQADSARRTVDARGRTVTPGFVDIHTHLDAQLSWDPKATSSCWHGVTSVVIGNCGVTFAPCRPEDRRYLAEMMESVEDIPADAIMDGLSWNWETYGQYLTQLGRLPKGVNVGGMIGHAALRWYAMGERALDGDPTADDLDTMCDLVDEAMAAGAFGFSSSRTLLHKGADGQPIPGTFAREEELTTIASVLARHGRGVFETAAMFGSQNGATEVSTRAEAALLAEVSRSSGRPVSFGLTHTWAGGDLHRLVLELVSEANQHGAQLHPQTTVRSVGVLFGLAHHSPFGGAPAWRELSGLTIDEKLATFADPARRERLVQDAEAHPGIDPATMFVLADAPAAYRYGPDDSLAAWAARDGVSPAEAYMRVAESTGGRAVVNWPFLNQSSDAVEELLAHPDVVLGLADAGAHVGQIMDASQPTWFLAHWVRDRGIHSLAEGVARLTSAPAELFGIEDRGVLRPGAYADLNVLDLDALALPLPEFVHDFPGGAGRWVQGGEGYDLTLVNGVATVEHGEHTGALPGTLLRTG